MEQAASNMLVKSPKHAPAYYFIYNKNVFDHLFKQASQRHGDLNPSFKRPTVSPLVRTVSPPLHLFQRRLSQRLVGELQLVSEPAQVPLGFGLHDAQLRVDVLVLICCIFLVLKNTMFGISDKG